MELHELKPASGSIKKSKRVGRGQGSGKGGTSKRGHKGAQSRSGYSRKQGHEGGQQPLQRRVPKFGFKNPFRTAYRAVNLSKLEELATDKKLKAIDQEALIAAGFVSKNELVKILGTGELTKGIEVKAHAFSKKAKEMIEKAGGQAVEIESK